MLFLLPSSGFVQSAIILYAFSFQKKIYCLLYCFNVTSIENVLVNMFDIAQLRFKCLSAMQISTVRAVIVVFPCLNIIIDIMHH